jgi:hypothetical protein
MSSTSSLNTQKTTVISFSTVNAVSMNDGTLSVDKNKFLLTSNTYTENYPGYLNAIVHVIGVRALEMNSETYQDNIAQFKEALTTYGTIQTTIEFGAAKDITGAINFNLYFLSGSGISQLADTNKFYYYSSAPIVIDGALKITLSSMTFSNNYKTELDSIQDYSYPHPAQAITLMR